MELTFFSGLPAVYQVYRREALRAKAFRRFSFCCFWEAIYQMSTKVIF